MTTDWSMIVLEPAEIAAGELEKIRAEVARFFLLHDPGSSSAVFTRRAKLGHCEVYFSPDSAAYTEFIFERHTVKSSRPPALLGSTLLVGYPAAVSCLLGKAPNVKSFPKILQRSLANKKAAASASFLSLKKAG